MTKHGYLPIFILNVKETILKRHGVAKRVKKQDLMICCMKETHFRYKDTKSENGEMKKCIPCKCKAKESYNTNTYHRQNTV